MPDWKLPDTDDYELPRELIFAQRYKDVWALAVLANVLGWTAHLHHGIILTAPDRTTFELPRNAGLNVKVFRSRVRLIVRHGVLGDNSPIGIHLAAIGDHCNLDPDHRRILMNAAKDYRHAAVSQDEVVEAQAEKVVARTSRRKRVRQPEPVSPTPIIPPVGESEPVPVAALHIVREEPWTAHGKQKRGVSTTYPSDAVLERRWSDGTIDYVCRWPDCDWTNDTPRSVAGHYSHHVAGQGRSPQPEPDGIDPDHVPNHRQQNRINNLRKEIDGALTAALAQSIDFSKVDQAAWLAIWIIEHRIERIGAAAGEEDEGPLSAEQILDKIAALADRGRSHILREQVDNLDRVAEQLREERDAEKARADRVESDLTAIRDMLNEARG